MRNFAIILDDEGHSRVVASKWLFKDKQSMYWPPFKKTNDVTEAIIHQKDVGRDWTTYPIKKYIKSNGRFLFH